MQKLRITMGWLQLPLPQQGNLALDETSRDGGRRLSFPQSPHQGHLQGMMENNPVSVFCLQSFLRTNKALPLAAMQNIVQGASYTEQLAQGQAEVRAKHPS